MTVEILNTNPGDTRTVTDSPGTLGDTRPSQGVAVTRPEYEPTNETPGEMDRGENPKGFSPTPTWIDPIPDGPSFAAYFWSNVQITPTCWIWTGRVDRWGYGRALDIHTGKSWAVHRYSLEMARGSLPARIHVHHVCGKKACVNPSHLEAITWQEHLAIHRRRRK